MNSLTKQALGAFVAICAATTVSATTLNIKVTNNQGADGFAVTPLYTAFHDGLFDAFDVGEGATRGLETIAETGRPGPATDSSTIAFERVGVDGDSVGGVVNTSAGPPPIQPGEIASIDVTVDPLENVFFTFLAMLLPSNDTFIGNDDQMAYQLFDATGAFLGPQTINVTGEDVYDAGTEINALLGSAFVAGEDISLGGAEDLAISTVTKDRDLSAFIGASLADGRTLGADPVNLLLNNPSALNLLTIEITEVVAPVPLPASATMMLAGFGLGGIWLRRRKKAA